MEEIWKDIEGYEKMYQVSNLGRIKSLSRIKNPNHHKFSEEFLMTPYSDCTQGYLKVSLTKNSIHKTPKVHRLVAKSFIDNPNNYPQVNHKNGIKTDNRAENLEWCTNRMNICHAYANNMINVSKGEDHLCSKLTEKQVLEIREKYSKGNIFQHQLGKEYGLSQSSIGSLIRKETWKHI